MRNGRLLFSAVQFLMILVLFGAGVVFIALHYVPEGRQMLADWILHPNGSFLFLGCITLSTAVLLTICFSMMQRTQYLRIQMKGRQFLIDEAFVKGVVRQFWKTEFPKMPPPAEIYFARQKIEIITQGVECDLEEIEQKLGAFLSQQLGYQKEFFVTLTTK